MDYLQRKRPEIYDYIIDNYEEKDWNNEACSYLVETVIDDYSIDDFLSSEFGGEEEIAKFATELQEYLKYGKEGKSKKEEGNQLRRVGAREQEVQAEELRDDLSRRDYNRWNNREGQKESATEGEVGGQPRFSIDKEDGARDEELYYEGEQSPEAEAAVNVDAVDTSIDTSELTKQMLNSGLYTNMDVKKVNTFTPS